MDFITDEIEDLVEYNKGGLFSKFKMFLGYGSDIFEKCPVKSNTFSRWLKVYAAYIGKEYVERRSNNNYIFRYR